MFEKWPNFEFTIADWIERIYNPIYPTVESVCRVGSWKSPLKAHVPLGSNDMSNYTRYLFPKLAIKKSRVT